MRIRTVHGRIVFSIVLVGCIPLLTGLILAYVSGMQSLRDVIGGNLQAVAVQAADRVSMLVLNEIQSVRLLGSTPLRVRQPVEKANRSYEGHEPDVRRVIEERAGLWHTRDIRGQHLVDSELSHFLLESKIRGGDKVIGLLIVDQYGALVAASSEPNHFYFGDESWWKTVQAGNSEQVYISGLIPAHEGSFRTPEEIIDIAIPIYDERQGTVIGAVKASYRFDALFAMIKEIHIGQTGHAMLYDDAGNPLVCPILPRQAHRIPAQLMAMIVSSQPGWEIAEDDGHGAADTVVGYAPVSRLPLLDNPWHVFVRQHPAESYAPIHDQLRNLAIIGLVMLGVLWALGRYVAARIARPIHLLKAGVEAISQGTYDRPPHIQTGDEFEELATAVHQMADRLRASRAELEGLNQDLARRIEEKTQEVTKHVRSLELAERLASLGKVASGIAHEINNPLGIILNRIECMEADASRSPLSDEVRRDLVAVRAQAERIVRVTRSILTFSRGTVSTLKPVDVNSVVRFCLTIADERVSALSVRLEQALVPSLPPIMGDRDRLETVFLNLINNAIDAVSALGAQGMVTVSTRTIQIDSEAWVEVMVSDNGPGIPDEIIGRVFDPFFSTKPVGQGTGLGLFLTHGIVSDHRGRIETKNGEVGARFIVMFPAVGRSISIEENEAWESQAKFS